MDFETLVRKLQGYIGGQLSIMNHIEGFHYRGEIETIQVILSKEGPKVEVTFKWIAKLVNRQWVSHPKSKYVVNSQTIKFSNWRKGVLRFSITTTIEFGFFYPSNSVSNLDSSSVQGLTLPQ